MAGGRQRGAWGLQSGVIGRWQTGGRGVGVVKEGGGGAGRKGAVRGGAVAGAVTGGGRGRDRGVAGRVSGNSWRERVGFGGVCLTV